MKRTQPISVQPIHLLRGASVVRSWSMYQETDRNWSLCGIKQPENFVDKEAKVTCKFCRELIRSGRKRKQAAIALAP